MEDLKNLTEKQFEKLQKTAPKVMVDYDLKNDLPIYGQIKIKRAYDGKTILTSEDSQNQSLFDEDGIVLFNQKTLKWLEKNKIWFSPQNYHIVLLHK
jgi:hypothetical protein